ncbi:hypothetical protein VHEMI09443 [[Torrubiella] hemipterigena]|uniref:Uncharacterized protein n=1 Tax=[Torrubiella] hemipterigena TaxID=1531966 RepID=A0A0A1T9X1_9HYPO|nr:hypothetical protein VHEMI09443 [[Torrubiella] hemipterigena]
MVGIQPTTGILSLPWELRRQIILDILQCSDPALPCFDEQFITSRNKYEYVRGQALRATNVQLRNETDQVIEELKSGTCDMPFTLDVMLVRGIGVFPNWIHFPYRPTHLQKLTINIRIIRPWTTAVPEEWVEMARYQDKSCSHTHWHIFMAITMIAFGIFSIKQDPTLPRVDHYRELAVTERVVVNDKAPESNTSTPKATDRYSNTQRNFKNIEAFCSETFDAYRLSSASWVTDILFLNFCKLEYDEHNKPIPPPADCKGLSIYRSVPKGVSESYQERRFYKPGYMQFGRDIFRDYSLDYMGIDEYDSYRESIVNGTFLSSQLEEAMANWILCVNYPDIYTSAEAIYLEILAFNVGAIHDTEDSNTLVDRYWSNWTYEDQNWDVDFPDGQRYYTKEVIERNLVRQLAHEPRDEEQILQCRILRARMENGWILESDDW